jgi:hypothetical protein
VVAIWEPAVGLRCHQSKEPKKKKKKLVKQKEKSITVSPSNCRPFAFGLGVHVCRHQQLQLALRAVARRHSGGADVVGHGSGVRK